jgi:DNA-directed RNA polymerase omega subunit
MARYTSQEAAKQAGGLFDLVLIASQRVRELKRGSVAKVNSKSGEIVKALEEIEQGQYTRTDYINNTKKKRIVK